MAKAKRPIKKIVKKKQATTGKTKYFAQWGPKGFGTFKDKVAPFWGLKTSFVLRGYSVDTSGEEPVCTMARAAQKITFNTRYLSAMGFDPKGQMSAWYNLVGEKWPFYIGGQQFGSPLLQLEDVKWSNFMLAPDGTIIGVDAEIHLIEWYEGIEIDQGWIKPESNNGETASVGDIMSGNATNEEKIWNFCRAHGFSAAATAGIMGNMWQESRCKPDTHEVGGYGGYGLCQWTNTGSGSAARKTNLINWCNQNGYNYRTLEGQLNYMIYEHKNNSYYWNNLGTKYMNLTDVWTATDRWLTYYEGCTVRTAIVNWPGRLAHAQEYYNKWKNYTVIPGTTGKPVTGATGNANTSVMPIYEGEYGLAYPLPNARNIAAFTYGGHTNLARDYQPPWSMVGTPVVSVLDGVVKTASYHFSYGNHVYVEHADGWASRYAHLNSINVKVGQRVKKGQVLGGCGSTGNSTGLHLHLELHAPWGWMDSGPVFSKKGLCYLTGG